MALGHVRRLGTRVRSPPPRVNQVVDLSMRWDVTVSPGWPSSRKMEIEMSEPAGTES